MFVIEIRLEGLWTDASSHTQETDAESQRTRFINDGHSADDTRIVEKNSFNPPFN